MTFLHLTLFVIIRKTLAVTQSANVGGSTCTDVLADEMKVDVPVKLEKGDYIYMLCRDSERERKLPVLPG